MKVNGSWSYILPGSAISNGREPKSCLGQVFNSKLGCIVILCGKCMAWHAATSIVENSAQGSSCELKFVHGWSILLQNISGKWCCLQKNQKLHKSCSALAPKMLVKLTNRYIKNMDYSSFVMCPLLAPHLPRHFLLFFAVAANYTNETNKVGSTCH